MCECENSCNKMYKNSIRVRVCIYAAKKDNIQAEKFDFNALFIHKH